MPILRAASNQFTWLGRIRSRRCNFASAHTQSSPFQQKTSQQPEWCPAASRIRSKISFCGGGRTTAFTGKHSVRNFCRNVSTHTPSQPSCWKALRIRISAKAGEPPLSRTGLLPYVSATRSPAHLRKCGVAFGTSTRSPDANLISSVPASSKFLGYCMHAPRISAWITPQRECTLQLDERKTIAQSQCGPVIQSSWRVQHSGGKYAEFLYGETYVYCHSTCPRIWASRLVDESRNICGTIYGIVVFRLFHCSLFRCCSRPIGRTVWANGKF